jgi:hypothetical protein
VSNSIFTDNIAQGDQAAHDAIFGGPAGGLDFAIGGGASSLHERLPQRQQLAFHHNIAQRGDGGGDPQRPRGRANVLASGADAFDG